ncbi:MAG: transglycosylase domain-containing protein, partial [Alphaproteobacteria bacterium]|nr:transglycosylase domain-containing protein [Alphaproteobacteria bacterium]
MIRPDAPRTDQAPHPWVRGLILAGFGLFVLGCAGAIQLASVTTEIAATLPPAPHAETLPVSAEVTDRDGNLLRPFATADGRWRLPVSREAVDPRFIDMLLAYEDRSFASHDGIAWTSMLR